MKKKHELQSHEYTNPSGRNRFWREKSKLRNSRIREQKERPDTQTVIILRPIFWKIKQKLFDWYSHFYFHFFTQALPNYIFIISVLLYNGNGVRTKISQALDLCLNICILGFWWNSSNNFYSIVGNTKGLEVVDKGANISLYPQVLNLIHTVLRMLFHCYQNHISSVDSSSRKENKQFGSFFLFPETGIVT